MDTAEIIVTTGGGALVAFILWLFFRPGKASQPRTSGSSRNLDAQI